VRGRLADQDLSQLRLPALVCAGIDRGVGDALRAQAAEAHDPGALVLSGAVSEASLLNLYRGASMLLYPSRYEGFGLPVLEAMQCGVPVIGARASSIPEIAGDAAILVDPLDVPAWIDAIESLTGNAARHADCAARGLRRAAMFSWTRTAEETLHVLRRSAGTARQPSQP
jgi:glycosyltransferase involved in cell wall biosynthesis